MDKPITIRERQLIFVNIPVIVSSSLEGAVNVEKLLRFYERIFAYHYMKNLIELGRKNSSQILYKLTRFYNIFIPLSFFLGTNVMGYLALTSKKTWLDFFKYLRSGLIPLIEQRILEQRGDIELTRVSVGDNLNIIFIAHVTNRENLSPKEILISSFRKNDVPIFEKDVVYFSDSETRVTQLAFARSTYITTVVEYDELKEKYGNMSANFLLLDFSSNEVIVLLLDKLGHHIKYTSTINEVLNKPQTAEVNLNQLLSLLKGVIKE